MRLLPLSFDQQARLVECVCMGAELVSIRGLQHLQQDVYIFQPLVLSIWLITGNNLTV